MKSGARRYILVELPSKVKIGGHWCRVRFPYIFQERSDLNGQAIYNSPREIRVAGVDTVGDKLDDSAVIEIFIHELIHQVCNVFNGGEQIEERVIEALAQGIFTVLTDNGWLKGISDEEGEESNDKGQG
jgi:hypothetical protein